MPTECLKNHRYRNAKRQPFSPRFSDDEEGRYRFSSCFITSRLKTHWQGQILRRISGTPAHQPQSRFAVGVELRRSSSNPHPLGLLPSHLLVAVVVDPGRVRRGVPRDVPGGLQVASVFEKGRDAGRPVDIG